MPVRRFEISGCSSGWIDGLFDRKDAGTAPGGRTPGIEKVFEVKPEAKIDSHVLLKNTHFWVFSFRRGF